jgi:hypothetical protein
MHSSRFLKIQKSDHWNQSQSRSNAALPAHSFSARVRSVSIFLRAIRSSCLARFAWRQACARRPLGKDEVRPHHGTGKSPREWMQC